MRKATDNILGRDVDPRTLVRLGFGPERTHDTWIHLRVEDIVGEDQLPRYIDKAPLPQGGVWQSSLAPGTGG